jgi:hypothetical protein
MHTAVETAQFLMILAILSLLSILRPSYEQFYRSSS